MAEARYGSGERRPSKAEIQIPGYRLGGCGGRGETELPVRGDPRAPVCCGKAGEGHGNAGQAGHELPRESRSALRVSDHARSRGLLRNGQKADEHLDALFWSLQSGLVLGVANMEMKYGLSRV